jgi:gliding motility-associated-like protein
VNKSFFIALILILGIVAKTEAQQNLVYNGDFEIYDTCPTGLSSPSDPQINHCLGWIMPTPASSDYLNVCAATTNAVPTNSLGYQQPYNGNGYCGFFAFGNSTYPWYEYVQGELTTTLQQGHVYQLTFHVCRAEAFDYAVSRIGVYFSNSRIYRNDTYPFLGVVPQVENPAGQYIIDTTNWTTITGTFIAQGGETILTIGYFQDTLSTDSLRVYNVAQTLDSYYYIDGVSLVELPSMLSIPNVFTPNGDGMNDLFFPNFENITYSEMTIYNRWGNRIKTCSITQGWDGNNNEGKPCTDGVYYFVVVANGSDDKKFLLKGFVQLLR